MSIVENIAKEMALFEKYPSIQLAQTAMRKRLVDAWAIPEGACVLEIGCGQGDLTAVLADAVGPNGRIVAVDLAGPDYGTPVSIGASTEHLHNGPYGSVINFRLGYDVVANAGHLDNDTFDYVVLAHSSWYFDSPEALREVLRLAHSWAPILCVSEWNLLPKNPKQFAHTLAVLLHGQVEVFRAGSDANIRNPYTLPCLEKLLLETGWHEETRSDIDCSELLDGSWEIDACLGEILDRASSLAIPERLLTVLPSERDLLADVASRYGKESLSSFALTAVHAGHAAAD